eukprot:CAMPEP_0119299768 /NCGR_PEP_ID=MMETSP1333-20130426/1802_1 /TAXON_ID=418940 /ORGANISM="Scyphosphaera apsteinii, Strain RCC1455" /LENGTH=124 /DNA_ID=CAMNT_0007301307 /DNA_START=203 /DNA_END=577 /DNA_ORIENTATION=-
MAAAPTHSSRLQDDVTHELAKLVDTATLQRELIDQMTGYSIDLAFCLKHSCIAVEVDGPTHFMLPDSNGEHVPTGKTLLKRRLLTSAGWRVVSIPYFEWNACNGNVHAQCTYLKRLLDFHPDFK